jgi:hypothetical protein
MTFDDLVFGPRRVGLAGVQAVVFFENGYGASVIQGYGSYGNEDKLYELGVIKGVSGDWDLCYDSGITEDVEGHLTPEAVTYYLQRIEAL